MEYKKMIVNGKLEDVPYDIDDEEKEENDFLGDTLSFDEIINKINDGDETNG